MRYRVKKRRMESNGKKEARELRASSAAEDLQGRGAIPPALPGGSDLTLGLATSGDRDVVAHPSYGVIDTTAALLGSYTR